MSFESEQQLATTFLEAAGDFLGSLHRDDLHVKAEVRAPGGVPDYVLYRYVPDTMHYLIAVEFKLANWRRALVQAFRYRNFANEAYVVLDEERGRRAVLNAEIFRAANVGLITINTSARIEVIHFPTPSIPFSAQFARAVAEEIATPEMPLADDLPFIRTARGGIAISRLRKLTAAA